MTFRRFSKFPHIAWIVAGLSLTTAGVGHAAGFGVKGGVGVLQKEDPIYGGTTNGQALWMVGGYLDLGAGFSSRLRITPSMEYSSRSNTKIISIGLEARYQFFQGPKSVVYVGLGPGINRKRVTGTLASTRATKGSLNVPIGLEWKLGKGGVRWTFEMKMSIADNQVDSAYRFGTGLAFVVK